MGNARVPDARRHRLMVQTYIPGFTNYLSGGPEIAYVGGASQPYDDAPAALAQQALPTAQPVQSAPYASAAPSNYSLAARRAYDNAAAKSFAARGELGTALDQIDLTQDFDYSPAALKYLQDVDTYASEQNTGYNLTPMNVGTAIDKQTGAPMPLTNAQLERYAASPVADQFYANFNYSAPGSAWDVGNLQFAPNQQYRIIDRATGDVLYSGTGYEAGAQASKLANDLFQKSGKMANWAIQTPGASEGEWNNRYWHDPETDPALGLVLGMIAPALGAIALPALGTMAGIGGLTAGAAGTAGALTPTVLGTGLGSALGTGALGAAQGKSLGDILKSSALSGLSAAGLQALMQGVGPSNAPTADAGSIGGNPADITVVGAPVSGPSGLPGSIGALGDIVVRGAPTASLAPGASFLSSGLNSALAAAEPSGTNYGDQIGNDITVEGQRPLNPVAPMPLPGLGGVAQELPPVSQPDQIVVEAQRPQDVRDGGALPGLGGVAQELPPVSQPDEIVVEGQKPQDVRDGGALPNAPLSDIPGIGDIAKPTLEQQFDKTLDGAKGTSLQDIIDYLQLAGLGTGLLGSLFGGKGASQASGRYSGSGTGGLNSTFSAQLPGATIPGLTGATQAPRTAAELGGQGLRNPQDWYRYGYGPQQSFFNYVPQALPNTSTAYTGYAAGGGVKGRSGASTQSFAVRGPGDGREDAIDARLSDGEYVIDAETVALLGNGSNKAGADKLDQFRVNVRKHKGRALARGKFSDNAKRPEQYLAGGSA